MINPIGAVLWQDLTLDHADQVRQFSQMVIGWTSSEQSMDQFNNYNIQNDKSDIVAGICNNKGINHGVHPQWIIYEKVLNISDSITQGIATGGLLMHGPRMMEKNNFTIISDSAEAVLGIMEDNHFVN